MGTDPLEEYLRDLGHLVALPADQERAMAEAEATGREAVDRATAEERRLRDAADAVARGMAAVEDQLRRLQARTGPVEALPAEGLPADLAAMPRHLEGMLRDLESAENAQAWVERARAQATSGGDRLVPPRQTAPVALPQPAPPAVAHGAAGPSRVVLAVVVALVLVIMVVVALVVT